MNDRAIKIFLTLFILLSSAAWIYNYACTSILVTKGASKNGATIISYSCDGEFHPILEMLPAADHKPGEMFQLESWSGRKLLIPQVAHTYKVVGLMNEYQLAIGETTFDGRLNLVNSEGYFDYYPLMRIALQRAKTAREAIKVMTSLVEEYGYCSTGESFSIADKEEAWIMEMIGMGPGNKGAVWVAVKVPDGYVSVHANMSRIHEFPLNDPENCIYSKNVISFAEKMGYYDSKRGKPFSFSDAYNPATEEQVRYSLRRVWSVLRRIAPSQNFSPDYSSFVKGATPYPLFVKPDSKLDVQDVIALHRDHYEGTEFDMTKNLSSGPFGAPDRWRPIKWDVDGKKYAWERPIATQQSAFVFVSESRADVPDEIGGVYWYGLDNPYTSVFVPLYTSITELPKSYTVGTLRKYSRDSAWWVFNFVANYANLRWSYMIKDIQKVQKEIESAEFGRQKYLEETVMKMAKDNKGMVAPYLTKYCVDNAEGTVQKWRDLGDFLITRYNDGYIQDEKGNPHEIGYPVPWLKKELKESGDRFKLGQERNGNGEL